MGTNFYLRKKISEDRKRALIDHIENDRYDEAADELYGIQKDHEIHIGKRSCGWKFLWDSHDFRYFDPNMDSVREWLRTGTICDEYGTTYTYDQFWNDELSGCIESTDRDLWDGMEYEKIHPGSYCMGGTARREFSERHGIDVNSSDEFYLDKYRFTIHEDFA